MTDPVSGHANAANEAPLLPPQTLKELITTRLDWTARYGLLVAALTTVMTTVGSALGPYLLVSQPLWLVVLAPLPRHMLLVAPSLDFQTFLIAGLARRVFATSGAVCLGARFGEAGVQWVEQRDARLRRGARWLRWALSRGGLFVVFVLPNPFATGAAVAMGARARTVMFVSSLGHITWLTLWYRFGDLLSEWIAPFTALIARYKWPATWVCIALVAVFSLRRFRRRSAG